MQANNVLQFVKAVLEQMPESWLTLTTHRLDIYEERLAKTQFLDRLEKLYQTGIVDTKSLDSLPTAYDYIRLGHPLSCVLEWYIASLNNMQADAVISFSSQTMPILAILRKNAMDGVPTRILYTTSLPEAFNVDLLKQVYGYNFEAQQISSLNEISEFNGSTIYIASVQRFAQIEHIDAVDFYLNTNSNLGSILMVNTADSNSYTSEIQHVRRRESIAMTPENCRIGLEQALGQTAASATKNSAETNKAMVLDSIQQITEAATTAVIGSSGLSMQYAIMMGLIHEAQEKHPGKAIKFVVPPNCYGGTNDQARRVAASVANVAVVDLLVDGENDMVQSVDAVLDELAKKDAIPYIIAEIPTNPRVEVPDMAQLRNALSAVRTTASGEKAIDPVFILDQTFCPNLHFLGDDEILSDVRTISYTSGSKFPSGGRCTAGYCVANKKANALMPKIAQHLKLCDNEATALQMEILAAQLPSMNKRIAEAYVNTRDYVNYIQETLPTAKINFVSETLAEEGFTPSVFSLDLPTKGNSVEEKEAHKRSLNLKLINLMITEIPNESKFCVSYGQLKGCYWTIPATSTQGTTKEGDKDYIVRVALSPDLDLELHKKVFNDFVKQYY